eukprot:2200842-Amphidinium_carterae.1
MPYRPSEFGRSRLLSPRSVLRLVNHRRFGKGVSRQGAVRAKLSRTILERHKFCFLYPCRLGGSGRGLCCNFAMLLTKSQNIPPP